MHVSYGPGEKLPARLENATAEVTHVGESYDASNGWPMKRWQERRVAPCGCIAVKEYDAISSTNTRVVLCDACDARVGQEETEYRQRSLEDADRLLEEEDDGSTDSLG